MYESKQIHSIFRKCLLLLWLIHYSDAYHYNSGDVPFSQQVEQPYNGGAYQFAYRTGSTQEQDLAQMFREESRDEFGNVQGKYGYVDPNGNMRVVNYQAGADGYYASGDIGVDQETLRQQRLLHESDEATQIQQNVWRKILGGDSTSSSSSSASAAASAAASASASSTFSGFHQKTPKDYGSRQDWTTVKDDTSFIAQQYNKKGGQNQIVDRLVARPAQRQPVTVNFGRFGSFGAKSNQYHLPVVRQSSSTSYQTVPGAFYPKSYSRYSSPTKSFHSSYSDSFQTPSAKFINNFNDGSYTSTHHSSSAASAAASASASSAASSSAFPSGSHYSSSGIKGSYTKSPYYTNVPRSARFSNPGQAHAEVNFKQFGPAKFQYSYSF
ncbi:hypothetical protein SSS_04739 [Sarcoptes scabiei]|uniref:Uncharacterized protein n=1 Tax=Sarcoptes scabiei TaxID=52283 RepID=A0A834RB36_SARSC|nr:hypothetical protein SSS_04739 [Sarcoptes scabiei]